MEFSLITVLILLVLVLFLGKILSFLVKVFLILAIVALFMVFFFNISLADAALLVKEALFLAF